MQAWQRTVRLLWVVQFLTTLAINLGLTFVPFFLVEDPVLRVQDKSERVLYTGLILGGPYFTTIIFTPLWGWIADRTGPKRQVVRACFGLGLTQLLMAVAQSPMQMVAIRIVQGMISGVLAACLGLVAVVTPRGHHGSAIASLQSATPMGQIFGPVLGGVLATVFGFRATYATLGTLILATGLVSWWLLRQDGFVPTASPNPFVGLYQSSQRAFGQPLLRQALVVLIVGQFAFTIAQGVFAIYAGVVIAAWALANDVAPAWWNSGVAFTAIAMTVTGLASVVSAPRWGALYDRGAPFLVPCAAGLLAGSMLLLFACPVWWAVLVARVGVGAGIVALSSTQLADIATRVPAEERNQLMALATAMTYVGNLAGFVFGGVLATWWTERGNFALAAAGFALIMLAALRLELPRGRPVKPAGSKLPECPARNHRLSISSRTLAQRMQ